VRAVPDDKWITNPYAANTAEGANPASVKTGVNVTLDSPVSIKELRSLQHQIETHWDTDKAARIALSPSETQAGNRDFILRFRLQDNHIVTGLMTFQQDGENHFLMMAQPPQRVSADQVMRREYLFVVDVSGSMHGFPLNTAKALMGTLLADLKPHESFNILFFSGGASVLAEQPLVATPANIARANAMMQSFEGGGGTELLPALEQAFAMPRTPDMARSIVVVSDGFISAERQAYDLIRARRNDTNLFAFGIGSSVNRFLIESLAHAGGGEPFVVTDAGAAGEVSSRFRQYVDAPLLRDIALKGRGVELYDLEPGVIPLMLAERPIVIFGKYRGAQADARLELVGLGAGGPYRVSLPLAEARTGAALLPMLWARQRLQALSDFAGEGVAANRDEIIKLGLGYSLLTRYTSFVAVDETVVPDAAVAKDVKQPLPLPQGVSELSLAREVPEPELLWLGLALALVIGVRALKSGSCHGRT
jgi:Ca-activated chloride channel family protein